MFRTLSLLFILTFALSARAGSADFEDLGLATNTFADSTPFTSRGVQFNNNFTDFGGGFTGWEGFARSTRTDTTTPGFNNQYSSIVGKGAGGSDTYGIGFVGFAFPPIATLPAGENPVSVAITNTTYAYLSMHDGDSFAKKFGGATGNDPDFLKLTITGKNASDVVVSTVDFYLADFRFANNAQDYLVNSWTTVDLTSLAGSRTLTFTLSSSDNGQFGMNTPAYFAIDNLTFVPEPSAVLGALVIATFFPAVRRGGRGQRRDRSTRMKAVG